MARPRAKTSSAGISRTFPTRISCKRRSATSSQSFFRSGSGSSSRLLRRRSARAARSSSGSFKAAERRSSRVTGGIVSPPLPTPSPSSTARAPCRACASRRPRPPRPRAGTGCTPSCLPLRDRQELVAGQVPLPACGGSDDILDGGIRSVGILGRPLLDFRAREPKPQSRLSPPRRQGDEPQCFGVIRTAPSVTTTKLRRMSSPCPSRSFPSTAFLFAGRSSSIRRRMTPA
jgi:hypothetical protein